MNGVLKKLMMTVSLSLALMIGGSAVAAEKPRMLKPCAQCHEVDSNQIRGRLSSISNKAQTLQLFTGGEAWQIQFSKDTELDGAPEFSKIGLEKEILVDVKEDGNKLIAEKIMVKQPASIPQKWILDAEAVIKILEKSPEQGNYAIYDARPGKLFHEGHIAGSILNYDAQFDKNLSKLPKDKDKLLIFYCGGMT